MPRFLLLPLVVLAATVWAACTASTEDATPTPSAGSPTATLETPTPTEPPGGAGGGLEGTAVAPTPFPSPEPVPADWPTYTDPGGLFTFRYPATWHILSEGRSAVILASWDSETLSSPEFPSNGTKLDAISGPVSQAEARPAEAADSTLGGAAGWEITYVYEPSSSDGLARVHQVTGDRSGYRFFLTAMFGPDSQDEATFAQIRDSFRFTVQPAE